MSSPSAERAPLRGLVLLAALAAAVFVAALLIGGSGIGVSRALAALAGAGDETTRSVLIAVRLPRVLAAFGVGSLLALSGVLLQALFRNSLADPYVLGVSGGAAVGALLAMIAGAAALVVQSAAVAGALGAVGTVYLLSRGGGTPRLLLTGVVLASACGALVSVLLALADTKRVRGMVRSEEHTSELQSRSDLVCRLLLEKKKKRTPGPHRISSAPHAAEYGVCT